VATAAPIVARAFAFTVATLAAAIVIIAFVAVFPASIVLVIIVTAFAITLPAFSGRDMALARAVRDFAILLIMPVAHLRQLLPIPAFAPILVVHAFGRFVSACRWGLVGTRHRRRVRARAWWLVGAPRWRRRRRWRWWCVGRAFQRYQYFRDIVAIIQFVEYRVRVRDSA